MAGYDSLPSVTQDLIMVQFEFFGKLFLLGFFLVFALLYIFKWRREQKETPYILVALARVAVYSLSIIYVFFIPLFIVYLYPQSSIDTVLKFVFLTYRYAILIIGLIVFINLMFYAPLALAKLGGLNIQSKNTSKVLDDLFGRYKKLFNRL